MKIRYRAVTRHTRDGTYWEIQEKGWIFWHSLEWVTFREVAQAKINRLQLTMQAEDDVIYPEVELSKVSEV